MSPVRWIAVLLLAGAFAPGARGMPKSAKRPLDADSAAVLKLEDEFARALVKHDVAVFRRQLAKGFVYTENDQMMNRDEMLKSLEATKDKNEEARNEDLRVHRFGDTIVVTGWLIVKGRGADGPFNHRYRFTDVWMRPKGAWQIVAAQDYLVPPAE
jgi:ketosteroid isomerase-like protein